MQDWHQVYVHVDTPKEQVKVRLPLRMVEGMVKALGQPSVTVGDLMACLESQPSGDLVYVKTPREEVRVWLW